MSEEATPTEELWIYAGRRVGQKGNAIDKWIDPNGTDLYFSKGNVRAVGSEYRVRVTRKDGSVTLHGSPEYVGMHEDADTRARLQAEHHAATTRLALKAMEAKAKRTSDIDEALEPLIKIAKGLSFTERDAFVVYVMRRLGRGAW